MSILDEARRLANDQIYMTAYAEDYSGASWIECQDCAACDGAHRPDCSFRSWPRIIAVLEAAERAHEAWYGPPNRFPPPEPYVRMVALGKALRGEEATG